jgi:23S rRNA pseudoU1915 N3-methylase RlmH
MKRKVKSVSFNLSDPFEQEMYEYTKRFSNFSTFVKRLIQNSLQSKNEQVKNAE